MKDFLRSLFKKGSPTRGYQPKICKSKTGEGPSPLPQFGTSVITEKDSFEHEKHKEIWNKIQKTSDRLLDLIDSQEFSEEIKREKYYGDVHSPDGLVKVCWEPADNNFVYSYMPTRREWISPTEELMKSNYLKTLIVANGLSEIEFEVRKCIREYENLTLLKCGGRVRPTVTAGKKRSILKKKVHRRYK